MEKQKLFIVYGTGNDAVGLVGKITTPISKVKGNIVDLRQDVMHGLFTIFLVVDLTAASVKFEKFKEIIGTISEETELKLFIDKYTPVARNAEKKNLLLILLGYDKPGIIAEISKTISTYNINIEFSQMVARADIFLMELQTDISHSSLPVTNLKNVLKKHMSAMGISTMFQDEDVFNKQKRTILFDIRNSFIPKDLTAEIMKQTGIKSSAISYYSGSALAAMQKTAEYLEGLPVEVIEKLSACFSVTPDTMELLQTLKVMGYKIGLITPAVSIFSEAKKTELGLDYVFDCRVGENDDDKTVTGTLSSEKPVFLDLKVITEKIKQSEKLSEQDIILLSDKDKKLEQTPGIRFNFDMKILLEYHNQHILNNENIIGVLGSFGIPHLG
jgi:predicted amino acid-binding ACT domain protein